MISIMLLSLSISFLLTAPTFVASAPQATTSSTPNLRIEGPTTTIFEGPITSGPRNITAIQSDAGLTHFCDGPDYGTETTPFNTALDALDAASKTSPTFTYTTAYDGDLSDFVVLSLAGYGDESWGLLYNWAVPPYGDGFTISGCHQEVQNGDDVLWAYNASATGVFLRVVPSDVTVKKGGSANFTITNGLGGKVQPGATIHGVAANSKGQVTVSYPTTGYFPFKAKETGAVRSNIVQVTVTN